jgi:hypothetical protein
MKKLNTLLLLAGMSLPLNSSGINNYIPNEPSIVQKVEQGKDYLINLPHINAINDKEKLKKTLVVGQRNYLPEPESEKLRESYYRKKPQYNRTFSK